MSDDEEVQPLSKRINRLNIDHAAAAVAAAANKATDRPPSQNSLQSQAHWYVQSLKITSTYAVFVLVIFRGYRRVTRQKGNLSQHKLSRFFCP